LHANGATRHSHPHPRTTSVSSSTSGAASRDQSVVDDFAVNTFGRQYVEHSMNTLTNLYQIASDWSITKYCVLTIDWDYRARTVDISMPGYVESVIHKFQYKSQIRPQDSPHA
jgi:hypothetical protein